MKALVFLNVRQGLKMWQGGNYFYKLRAIMVTTVATIKTATSTSRTRNICMNGFFFLNHHLSLVFVTSLYCFLCKISITDRMQGIQGTNHDCRSRGFYLPKLWFRGKWQNLPHNIITLLREQKNVFSYCRP